ncbi:MAG: hypothetical protein ACQESR_13510 [Planctomycetota bacterium]
MSRNILQTVGLAADKVIRDRHTLMCQYRYATGYHGGIQAGRKTRPLGSCSNERSDASTSPRALTPLGLTPANAIVIDSPMLGMSTTTHCRATAYRRSLKLSATRY